MESSIKLTSEEFRFLTWARPQLTRMTMQPESLQKHCPLDNGRLEARSTAQSSDTSASTGVGDLDGLPLEIIQLILAMLDLQVLTYFRGVSWQARRLVDSFLPYDAIIRYSPDALRALLSTHMATHFTAQDIFRALRTEACFGCKEFGPFLDLFTGYRYCLNCVMFSDALLCITASSAKRKFHLTSKTMRLLPTLLSIPGQYTESEREYRVRRPLVRLASATSAASIQRQHSNGSQNGLPQEQLACPRISLRSFHRLDRKGQNPYRFMSLIRIPCLDQRTKSLEWGVSCQSCRLGPRHRDRGYHNWNTVYSTAGYLEHFQNCQLSRKASLVVPEYFNPDDQHASNTRFLAYLSNSSL